MVLAPCHSRNMPQCVEIFNESNLQGDRLDESIAKAQDLCNAVQDERKRLEEWRKVRNEEGLQFQSNKETSRSVPAQGSNWVAKSQSTTSSSTTTDTTMRSTTAMSSITTSSSTNITTSSTSTCPSVSTTPPTQTSESSIKDFRRNRVTSEPNGRGITIAIGLNDGKTITRTFEKNAFFQEVYDWVGSLDDVPLHFTLQRGKEVVRHTDALNQDELLELTERSPVEMRDLLETTVSFKGNYEYDRDENHSKTIEDEQKMHDEKGVEGREDEDNGDSDKGVEGREDEDNGDSDKGVEGREDDDNGDSDKGVEGREDDDNGDSDNDEKEEAIFENQKKRKRKDKRTTKDRRKKQKNVEKPN